MTAPATPVAVASSFSLGCAPVPGQCRVCGAAITGRRLVCAGSTLSRQGRTVKRRSRCELIFLENHDRNRARRAAKALAAAERSGRKTLAWACNRCGGLTTAPEVNHIVPVNGVRTWRSCLNHQDNLEVLCHACHSEVTAAQRRVRQERLRAALPQD